MTSETGCAGTMPSKKISRFLELQLHTGVISRFSLGWRLQLYYLCISCSDISKIASKFTESSRFLHVAYSNTFHEGCRHR
ncbi:hypothetical protein GW17_00020854 [Ensete ventricosum]|nr:hypothetical protein GW17_00020854 [Ensete ventricosum]